MPETQDELAALDRAATQGQWVPNEVGGGAFSTWDHMPVLAGKTTDVDLCCNLVNAYRTGKLVLIDDGAVEAGARVRRYLAEYAKMSGLDQETVHTLQGGSSREAALHIADLTALAALGVK